MFKQIKQQIIYEATIDWSNKSIVWSTILYLFGAIFICYLSLKFASPSVWSTLFWVLFFFSANFILSKSFIQDSRGKLTYNFTLISPENLIISKIIYNIILLLILSILNLLFFSLFFGLPVVHKLLFLVALILATIGVSSALTMTSAMSYKANNQVAIMSILSLPVIMPTFTLIVKIAKQTIDGLDYAVIYPNLLGLLAVDLIVIALAYLLFPYLWRD